MWFLMVVNRRAEAATVSAIRNLSRHVVAGLASSAVDGSIFAPRRYRQQQRRGRVEQQRDNEDKPPQHHLVSLAEQGGEIFHRPEIGLDGAALALDGGLLDPSATRGRRAT
jgi:hypothetical protein